MLRMLKVKVMGVLMLVTIILMSLVYCVQMLPKVRLSSDTRQSLQAKPSEKSGNAMLIRGSKLSSDERREEWLKWAHDQRKFDSVFDAEKELDFELKAPESLAVGQLLGIYVSEAQNSGEKRRVWMYFDDPSKHTNIVEGIDPQKIIHIYTYPESEAEKSDFAAHVEQQHKDRAAGINKADKSEVVVDVNGNGGIGIEPGYNAVGDHQELRPGVVGWWENGVSYTLYGAPGPDGTSLETLLEIARSMK